MLKKQQTEAYDAIQKWVQVEPITAKPENNIVPFCLSSLDTPAPTAVIAREYKKQVFTLGGFAGTGKTFLLSHLIDNSSDLVVCCAPTGKAASVLSAKLGGFPVSTVHSLLYKPFEKNYEAILELKRDLKENPSKKTQLELNALMKDQLGFSLQVNPANFSAVSLIIVDEASMLNDVLVKDLITTGCRLLFVGDPGQLPPIGGKDIIAEMGFDYTLTDIQRQAMDSPIIRLSMDIRKGTRIDRSQYATPECLLATPRQVKAQHLSECDQVITGKNENRHKLNRIIRKYRGLGEHALPQKGEKLICLKNEQEKNTGMFGTFINGVQCYTTSEAVPIGSDMFHIGVHYEGRDIANMPVYDYHTRAHYEKRIEELPWRERFGMREFDYGYVITAHKSQGSEWDNVIVVDDKMQKGKPDFRKRWLYTAITRAKSQLTLVDLT